MTKKFILGIDLGTSNSCLSFSEVENGRARGIDITQVLGPGVIGEKPLLPSALYIPASGEYAEGSLALPWDAAAADCVVGAFARERAALVPDRVVTSAKSWLCNPHVDRRAQILPWQSDLAEAKVSPMEASRRYLCAHAQRRCGRHSSARASTHRSDDCQVVLTVPASFDEVARELTLEAAVAAGSAT